MVLCVCDFLVHYSEQFFPSTFQSEIPPNLPLKVHINHAGAFECGKSASQFPLTCKNWILRRNRRRMEACFLMSRPGWSSRREVQSSNCSFASELSSSFPLLLSRALFEKLSSNHFISVVRIAADSQSHFGLSNSNPLYMITVNVVQERNLQSLNFRRPEIFKARWKYRIRGAKFAHIGNYMASRHIPFTMKGEGKCKEGFYGFAYRNYHLNARYSAYSWDLFCMRLV